MEHSAKLARLCDLIVLWNSRINLLRFASKADLWRRHIHDSQQLAELIPKDAKNIGDLGSGAGMPGLVLAIGSTTGTFHLIEADRRKAAFLVEAARVLDLSNVVVHPCRSGDLVDLKVDALVARAVAPLPLLLAYAIPILAPTGCCIFPKGVRAELELTRARAGWTMHVERFPSRTDPEATILRLTGIQRIGVGP